MWFSVVCALIDNDMHHHGGQNVVNPQQILTTGFGFTTLN